MISQQQEIGEMHQKLEDLETTLMEKEAEIISLLQFIQLTCAIW